MANPRINRDPTLAEVSLVCRQDQRSLEENKIQEQCEEECSRWSEDSWKWVNLILIGIYQKRGLDKHVWGQSYNPFDEIG
jgi:hypothetical protein